MNDHTQNPPDAAENWQAAWQPMVELVGQDLSDGTVAWGADPIEPGAIHRYLEPLEFDCPLHYDREVARQHGHDDVTAPYTSISTFSLPAQWRPGEPLFISAQRDAQPAYSPLRGARAAVAPPTTAYFATEYSAEDADITLQLHQGSGELQTVTGVDLVRSHSAVREQPYRLSVGLIGAEAMLRLFGEPEANERAFAALARFLDLLDDAPPADTRPALDPLALSFQLKLLWLAGYLPHLTSCVECGAAGVAGLSPRAGGAVCRDHAPGALALSAEGLAGAERLLSAPLADAPAIELTDRARRETLAVVTSSYEEHGGFRLRTLRAG